MTPAKNEWEERFDAAEATLRFWILKDAEPVKAFIRAEKEKSETEILNKVLDEIRGYREDLRFIWRWIDRLHGGKPHDKPEENWRTYVGCLINYPNAPHQTGDWYEDDSSSQALSDLTDKLTNLTRNDIY